MGSIDVSGWIEVEAAAGAPGGEDGAIVGEGELGEGVGRKDADLGTLLTGFEGAAGSVAGVGDEDDALAGLGVDAEHAVEGDLDAGLFCDLANCGVFGDLAGVDEAGGKRPTADLGIMVALAQHDAAVLLDDDSDGHLGVLEVDAAAPRTYAARLAERLAHFEPGTAIEAECCHRQLACHVPALVNKRPDGRGRPEAQDRDLKVSAAAKYPRSSADPLIVIQDEESSVLASLRREPERSAVLVKLSLFAAVGAVAWAVVAAMVLPGAVVALVLALLVLAYGAAVTYLVARIMASSTHWASGSASVAKKLASHAKLHRGVDVDALRRRPDERPREPHEGEAESDESRFVPDTVDHDPSAFNEAYFLMRLQEQVKDARRAGYEMCVAAVHVTLPGMETTPGVAEAVAYDVARIASEQARIMSLPLALSDSEFVFSLPHTGLDDTKQFVREVVRALGEYWCYFGIAAFPDHATDAQGLVEKAREACDSSTQSGKRGRVEYSVA